MVRKQIYAVALVYTTFIFLLGIMAGSYLSDYNYKYVQEKLQEDALEMQGLDMEITIVNGIRGMELCGYIDKRMPEIIEKKVELGKKIDSVDKKDLTDLLKKQYTVSLMKYWLFFKLRENDCNRTEPNILFFFDESEISREQGKALDYAVYKSHNLTVFAFNTEWNEPTIELLKNIFNITKTPSLIIENEKYEGYQTEERIEEILCQKFNDSCKL